MNTKLMLAMAALGTFGMGAAFASSSAPTTGAMTDDDPLPFVHAGEFMLQDGQVLGVADSAAAKGYRICVGKAEKTPHELTGLHQEPLRNVGLKVMFDGDASTLKPGTCSDFYARNIKITPNSELSANEVLMGRYEDLG